MTRALTTIAAIAALAVTAAPVASAATSKKAPPRGSIGASEVFELNIATKRVGGKMHLEDISLTKDYDKSSPSV